MKKLLGIIAITATFLLGIVYFVFDGSTDFTYIDTTKENSSNLSAETKEVISILKSLQNYTKISFSEFSEEQFQWKTSFGAPYQINGLSIFANDVLITKAESINTFFTTSGFSTDEINSSKELTFAQTGLIKNDIVCLYQKRVNIDNADKFLDEIVIKCGYIQK